MNFAALIDGLLREFRHAVRTLGLNATFSLTVILTLALGIGATTAIFSVVNGVVIKPLPYPDSEKVVTVGHSAVFSGVRTNEFPFSPQWLQVYGSNGRAFEEFGIIGGGQATVTGAGDPELVSTYRVSAGTLRALAVQPGLGRWFSDSDDRPGAAETVILSDGFWQLGLGADPAVIGRTITIDGRPREVIGVMPPHFDYVGQPMDLILPLQIDLSDPPPDFEYRAVARLADGMTLADANADVARMLPLYLEKYVGNRMDALRLEPAVRPLKDDVVGNVGQVLWVLLGSISILLLIACANVANLLLMRTETRGTELAVRTALGAGSAHLARGIIAESLTFSLLGGLAGVALAYGGVQFLLALAPGNLPRLNDIAIDPPVLGFALGMSIFSGLSFGLVPALRLAGRRFASNLAEFVNGGGRWASVGKHQQRSQNMLVVIQVALALVMLVSSGLMIRTFQNLRDVKPGFSDPETVQTVRISISADLQADSDGAMRQQRQILEQLAAIPGIESAGYIDLLPMDGAISSIVAVEDKTYASDETPPTRTIKSISPGLLQTLGTRLIAGRDFDWLELENQRNVAMVSERFAREEWNTVEGALGKRILVGTDGTWQEVIGVVADIYDNGVDQDPPATVYWPARLHPLVAGFYFPISVSYTLRTDRTGTESLSRDIREAVARVAPELPIAELRVLSDVYEASMARTAFSLVLLGIAGAMSLAISIVGIYGVLAYAVMQRRREVGIRLAVGAEPRNVRTMFVYRGMALSAIGIGLGLVVAIALTRLMSSLLFGVPPVDLLTFTAAAGFLALAALFACYLPARRAAGVDPSETLRRQ